MKMNKMFAAMTAAAMAATSLAAMCFTASAADEIATATIMGSFGTESNWGGEEANPNVSVASITGDGQYELTWTLAEATNTGAEGFFVTVVISPTAADNFTTDSYENLNVTLDEVWVDGAQLTDYDASAAVDMAYYESAAGVTRIYLRGDWAGNTTQILTDNMDITTDMKVVFSIEGTEAADTTDPDAGEDTPVTPDAPVTPEVPANAIASATLMGSFGTESNWGGEEQNPNVSVAYITEAGQYELSWDLAGATETGTAGFFLTAVISPISVDNFTTDTFPNLEVTLDEVWIDGTQLTDYDASTAVDMAYYETDTGVTRIYLRGDWAGNDTKIIADSLAIESNITVKFSVANMEAAAAAALLGDANEDGAIDATDAAAVLIDAAATGSGGTGTLTDSGRVLADVNVDTAVDASDAANILRYAAAVGSGFEGTMEEFLAA